MCVHGQIKKRNGSKINRRKNSLKSPALIYRVRKVGQKLSIYVAQ